MKCKSCGTTFVPWCQQDESNEIEAVAVLLGTICRPCFLDAFDEFVEDKAYAEKLKADGVDPRMVDRIMMAKERLG